jgi:hypothetical protein
MKVPHFNVNKVVRKNRNPIEVAACTICATLLFVYVYEILGTQMRHDSKLLAFIIGPGIVTLICLGLTFKAVQKKMDPEHRLLNPQKEQNGVLSFTVNVNRNRALFINLAIVSWGALIAGFLLGEHSYFKYRLGPYSYKDLISYVDVDPSRDVGQSLMDAGHMYFKENSYVLGAGKGGFSKFHNGDTYCAAPIVRGDFKAPAKPTSTEQIVNGYVVPKSGTYDFWAVGINCCSGAASNGFKCGQVNNPLARAGMRLLSDNQRPFYVLAVQEWSAQYGLPVKHPLFFEWVKDPIETENDLEGAASTVQWSYIGYVFLAAFIISFLIHMALFKTGIY